MGRNRSLRLYDIENLEMDAGHAGDTVTIKRTDFEALIQAAKDQYYHKRSTGFAVADGHDD